MDWELQQELEDFRREMEWESSVKCDSCGATYLKENMCAIGYGHKYLCDSCWDELEEEDY